MRNFQAIELKHRTHLIADPMARLGVAMFSGLTLGAGVGLWLFGGADPLLAAALGAGIGGAVGASLFGVQDE